jgi:hypothetical protein
MQRRIDPAHHFIVTDRNTHFIIQLKSNTPKHFLLLNVPDTAKRLPDLFR